MLIIIIYGLATTELDTTLSRQQKSQHYLQLYVSWVITSAGFAYGFGHIFMGDKVAKSIGWGTDSEFQKEIGFANFQYCIARYCSPILRKCCTKKYNGSALEGRIL